MITLRRWMAALLCASPALLWAEVNKVETVAPNVYFHEGDITRGHCNNGWVVLDDYVLVIDANFPSGAHEVIPKIRQLTDKPIRFAFDTHHHGDHAYGNQVWVENGATPVAHTGVVEEMKRLEPGRWNDAAKGRPDVANSKLKLPTLLFPDQMYFDDGQRRVELRHFGVAHTKGDGFAWLPKERILFTGDACVNGPYNFTGDGDIHAWIKTLERAKQLKPVMVCPGHGPTGDGSVLEDQQMYFRELLAQAKKLRKSKLKKPEESIAAAREALKQNPRIARYVGDFFPHQLEKAYMELGGKPFLAKQVQAEQRDRHLHSHGHDHSHDRDHAHPKPAGTKRS